jgi:type IV pilus assembly protein PilC
LIAFVGTLVGLGWWHETPKGCRNMDAEVLRIPLVGMVLRNIAVARYTQTLGTLIPSSVSILDGLTMYVTYSVHLALSRLDYYDVIVLTPPLGGIIE